MRMSKAKRAEVAARFKAARERAALERAAVQQSRVDAIKGEIQQIIAQDATERRVRLLANRPQTVIEYCQAAGLPLDTIYHPRYCAVGVDPETSEQGLESICFGREWPAELGGLGGYGHLRRFVELTWPDIKWNPWLEMCMRSLTDDEAVIRIGQTKMRFISWVGAGSSGKTFAAGLFACAWYICDIAMGKEPRTSITLTSTSKGIIAQRIWPVIQKCFHDAKLAPGGEKFKWGHMVDSQKMVLGLKSDGTRDAKHSICALAVEPGELVGALDKIKGRHTERMMLIVDEGNSTPQAIFENVPNMLTSAREFILLVIGNAGSRLDPHGLCCEPRKGWRGITIEDTQWETKGVAKWGIGPGIAIHFDAAKSPNVLAGRTEHQHIYSFERWQQVQRMGEEYRNTLQHWSQDRGFWPPDGLQCTVFTEAMVVSHDGTGKFHWLFTPRPCAALDPAFGGDQCVLVRGLLGELHAGKKGLQIVSRQLVPFDPDSPDDIQAQIARYVVGKCKEWKVEPGLFGTDSTGSGRGVAGFIVQSWSPHILSVEFGGNASELPASLDDPRASHEIYQNRVTELWYSARDMLVGEQLKGLYPEAINDFCSRVYEYKSRRYRVEKKEEMRLRLGRSPDDGDAVAVLVEVGRRNGLVAQPFTRRKVVSEEEEERDRLLLDAVYNDSYSAAALIGQYADVDY